MLIIKNAVIHTAVNPETLTGDILIEEGKIAQIGKDLFADGAEVFDAAGMDVYPGFIDAHTHIGMFGFSAPVSQDDVDLHDRCVPQQRGIDCINPEEPSFRTAVEAGVTCVCVGPGSVSCIAGTHVALKTHGHRVDDMVVKDPVAMKVAFGENPKKASQDRISTRMAIASTIRDTLCKAKAYAAQKEAGSAAYDPKLEALIPVVKKEIPLKAHAHRKDDIFTAIRIAKECDVRLTLEHTTDSCGIAAELAKEGYPIAVGPYFGQPKKSENQNCDPANAVELVEAGCSVSVTTDSPIVAEKYLPLCAGLLMREGLDEFRALQTITINPAKHLGIDGRVGSIEVGKDADLVIAKGCPMEMTVKPAAVFVNGNLVYGR
jgi:imidazolonepropionase-like amidohydrolase